MDKTTPQGWADRFAGLHPVQMFVFGFFSIGGIYALTELIEAGRPIRRDVLVGLTAGLVFAILGWWRRRAINAAAS
jgi:hypothetical protein